jgi:uncharacterized protein with GYD domain
MSSGLLLDLISWWRDDLGVAVGALGGRVVGTYWTLGSYDFVSIVEAPDDATVTAGLLVLGAVGNARTVTTRAFDTSEMEKIVATAQSAGG